MSLGNNWWGANWLDFDIAHVCSWSSWRKKDQEYVFSLFFLHIFFPWHKIKVLDKHTTKLVVQRHQYTSNCFRIFRRGAIFIVMKVKKIETFVCRFKISRLWFFATMGYWINVAIDRIKKFVHEIKGTKVKMNQL